MGDQNGLPGYWFQYDPHLSIAVTWGVNQQRDNLLCCLFLLCHSFKYMNLFFFKKERFRNKTLWKNPNHTVLLPITSSEISHMGTQLLRSLFTAINHSTERRSYDSAPPFQRESTCWLPAFCRSILHMKGYSQSCQHPHRWVCFHIFPGGYLLSPESGWAPAPRSDMHSKIMSFFALSRCFYPCTDTVPVSLEESHIWRKLVTLKYTVNHLS